MIIKKIFFITIISLELVSAKQIADCRVMIRGVLECNPYSQRLQYVKTRTDEKGRTQFFSIKKSALLSKEIPLKIISSQEILLSYLKHSKSLYFEEPQIIPTLKASLKIIETSAKLPSPPIPKIIYAIYSVSEGDVLGTIANKFEMSLASLIKLNTLKDKSSLRIGQKLNIPMKQDMVDSLASATYKIKEGDTVMSIAKKFKFTVKALLKFNLKLNAKSMKVGKVLYLPLPYILRAIKKEQKLALSNGYNFTLSMHRFGTHKLRVTATAYTSHRNQTDSTPFLAAWNNPIRPGMRMIAVSRDLLKRNGIKNGTKVRIAGLPGFYRIKDKMNKRYRKRIDIYMGLNKRKAIKWGKRSVLMYW